jgi:hypothetical protein
MGQLLEQMRENGKRAKRGEPASQQMSRGATSAPTLSDVGIPRDRASRATQLAEIPEEEFEAALTGCCSFRA